MRIPVGKLVSTIIRLSRVPVVFDRVFRESKHYGFMLHAHFNLQIQHLVQMTGGKRKRKRRPIMAKRGNLQKKKWI
jgi:hypothetical protein